MSQEFKGSSRKTGICEGVIGSCLMDLELRVQLWGFRARGLDSGGFPIHPKLKPYRRLPKVEALRACQIRVESSAH